MISPKTSARIMNLPKIFYQKPWHLLVLCIVVLTSSLTYLITADIFRTDARLKLDICLYHLHMREAKAYRHHSFRLLNQTCRTITQQVTSQPNRDKIQYTTTASETENDCRYVLPSILILTPFDNFASFFNQYFNILNSLSYPHCRLRIAIGIDKYGVPSPKLAQRQVSKISHKFRSIEVYHLDIPDDATLMLARHSDKHNETIQLNRRRRLAQVRNFLLMSALRDEKYVLWLDSDLREVPHDLIQTLLSAHVPIVVPSCMYRKAPNTLDIYDRNSWRETKESKEYLNSKEPGYLMLEGYMNKSLRQYLPELKHEGKVVSLDGVGSSCLLVDANVHRRGVIFPPYLVNHHLESEGFAQIAKSLNYQLFGMPNIVVIH
ncbi:mannan polymerase complex subunit mnn9 [Octopus sinensis]|uniref:Mannan polymerase complex subunit mnn9 n=1 Tax=Octopus sinensis TaxID=2607531 RepID=A0A6P7TIM6_9MOLL|nr:mannan polymerase complex subunit mnn9 [Octopus sinensis]XP_036369092.1 mannan polymerase complex subunit mnn9 [Octopus sinensis]